MVSNNTKQPRPPFFKAATCAYLLGSLALGQTTNMLTNGGFESGLMCYSNFIWNVANDAFASDYQFLASSDAHSGNSSLEIRCVTANCVKAAIISAKIPTAAAQAYKLSIWAKCPAGRESAVYVPNTLGGGNAYQVLTCNGNWAQTTVNFTVAADATDFHYSIYNRSLDWLRLDDVVLTYADGTVPQTPIVHAGNRTVGISGQHLNVDGRPYFALGFDDVRYGDLGQVASLGANTISGLGINGPGNCSSTAATSYLDRAYDFGLNFLPDSTTTARLNAPGLFTSVASQYTHHLANIGWFLADEPDQWNVPSYTIQANTLIAEYQTLASQTTLPIAVNFQRAAWSSPSDTAPFLGSADIWMAEPYGPDFGSVTHAVNTFNGIASKPIWLYQDDIDANLIVPKAYWAAIRGVTGIFYFNWDSFKGSPGKLAAAAQVFSELNQLSPAIFATNIDSSVTPPAGIGAIARSLNGSRYILAANPASSTVLGTFNVTGLSAGTAVQVLFENRTLTSTAGGFDDAFAGVSRHVYLIAPAIVKQTPTITWANPAATVAGTALSATQLNASANVSGSFVYSPAAGTVLGAGNSQMLSVVFTPTDTNSYNMATAMAAINVTAPRPAQIVITRTISRNQVTRELIVNMNISNTGGVAAQNVQLTTGNINATAGTPLPQTLGTIAPGQTVTATLRFPPSAGSSWMLSIVAIGGNHTGGAFSNVTRALLP